MSSNGFVIVLALLGLHFLSGYCKGKELAAIKAFSIGAGYSIIAIVVFFSFGVSGSGWEAALRNAVDIKAVLGGIAFILVSGAYCAWPGH